MSAILTAATGSHWPAASEPLVVIENQAQEAPTWREALKRDPFLRLNKASGLGSLIDESLKRFRISVDEAMELDSTDSIVQMTLSGLGSGVVPMGRFRQKRPEHCGFSRSANPRCIVRWCWCSERATPLRNCCDYSTAKYNRRSPSEASIPALVSLPLSNA